MIYMGIREDGRECVASAEIHREYVDGKGIWNIKDFYLNDITTLRKGTIEKITGIKITWKNEPIEVDMSYEEVTSI